MATGIKEPERRTVPSKRKQLNIRLDPETESLFAELWPAAAATTGLQVSQSDVVRLALRALREQYIAAGKLREKKSKN